MSTVTRVEEGALLITYATRCLEARAPLRVDRLSNPQRFDEILQWQGALSVGETAPFRVFQGHVQMNEDRTLTYSEPGTPHFPPYERTIQLGEARYDELLANVGGLAVGERKVVTRILGWAG